MQTATLLLDLGITPELNAALTALWLFFNAVLVFWMQVCPLCCHAVGHAQRGCTSLSVTSTCLKCTRMARALCTEFFRN